MQDSLLMIVIFLTVCFKSVRRRLKSSFFVTYGDSLLSVDMKLLAKNFDPNKGPLMCIYKNDNKFDKSNCKISSGTLFMKKIMQTIVLISLIMALDV